MTLFTPEAAHPLLLRDGCLDELLAEHDVSRCFATTAGRNFACGASAARTSTIGPANASTRRIQIAEAMMEDDERTRHLMRDRILELLSDDEVARVSTAESAVRLVDGDEYLDLEALEQGVRRASGSDTPMGRVLLRRAVHDEAWLGILRELAGAAVAAPPSRGGANIRA